MIRLLRVELRRLTARRAVRSLTLAWLTVLVMIGIGAIRDAGASPGPGDFVFSDRAPDAANIVGGTLAVYAFLVGATYAGAEWAAGTIQALLTWEPRRVRVLLAKLAALSIAVVVVGVIGHAVLTTFAAVASKADGSYTGFDDGLLRTVLLAQVRALALGVFGGALAFGISGISRSTGATLGVGFVYFAIAEQLLRVFVPRLNPFLVGNGIGAWLTGEVTLAMPGSTVVLTRTDGGVLLLAYAGAVVAVMTVLFARRDVT